MHIMYITCPRYHRNGRSRAQVSGLILQDQVSDLMSHISQYEIMYRGSGPGTIGRLYKKVVTS